MLNLKESFQSYFKKERQQHLPPEIHNFQAYTNFFERLFYYSLNDLQYYYLKRSISIFLCKYIKGFFFTIH